MSRELNTYGYPREDWMRVAWGLQRAVENARTDDERAAAHDEVRDYLRAIKCGDPPPLPRGLKPLILRPPRRDPKPDVVACECGAWVSWAVYLDHHGSRPRDPDPTEDTNDPAECECGEIVLGAGWLPFHRNGRCHRRRMMCKARIAAAWRAGLVREGDTWRAAPVTWVWCECGAQTTDLDAHRARMHAGDFELARAA